MATRTLNQNNFYFAFITDIHKQALVKHITVENMDYMRNGLKEIDSNYPRYIFEGHPPDTFKKISSSHLSTKEMVNHIEFIIKFVAQFDIVPKFVQDDWDRLMKQAHGSK